VTISFALPPLKAVIPQDDNRCRSRDALIPSNIGSFECQDATGSEVLAAPGRSSPWQLTWLYPASEVIALSRTYDDDRYLRRLCDRSADCAQTHATESAAAVAADNHQLRVSGFLN
jgi:hypothetical protein